MLSLSLSRSTGTKWCGTGDIAETYSDLGSEMAMDRCCRQHDLCPVKIRAYQNKYELTNESLYTKWVWSRVLCGQSIIIIPICFTDRTAYATICCSHASRWPIRRHRRWWARYTSILCRCPVWMDVAIDTSSGRPRRASRWRTLSFPLYILLVAGQALIQLFIELLRHIDRVRRSAGGIGADTYIYIYIYRHPFRCVNVFRTTPNLLNMLRCTMLGLHSCLVVGVILSNTYKYTYDIR